MKYKSELEQMMKTDYEAFCKALFSIELSITDEGVLDKKYQNYMKHDEITLLNEFI
ncbi:hypothetical protein [uncultured Veillonella sp.]|uniref:hypothetical protein n=1 Tax=uncultured Veillonella sp. TaxID=159268 RepID=UPI00262E564D|nr:hypothetical protein [uncultured Veillonella sp.]